MPVTVVTQLKTDYIASVHPNSAKYRIKVMLLRPKIPSIPGLAILIFVVHTSEFREVARLPWSSPLKDPVFPE